MAQAHLRLGAAFPVFWDFRSTLPCLASCLHLSCSLSGVSVKAVDLLLNQCIALLHNPVKVEWISKYMLLEMGVVWASLTAGELQYVGTGLFGCLGQTGLLPLVRAF